MALTLVERQAHASAYNKSYRLAHLEQRRASDRAQKEGYHQSHREARLAYAKVYRSNPEHQDGIRAYQRVYGQTHREERRAYLQIYNQNHREEKNESNARRRGWKSVTQVERVSYRDIEKRDRMMCGICSRKVAKQDLSFDHIIPLSKGGAHIESNLQVAHLRCNTRRGAGCLPAQTRLEIKWP